MQNGGKEERSCLLMFILLCRERFIVNISYRLIVWDAAMSNHFIWKITAYFVNSFSNLWISMQSLVKKGSIGSGLTLFTEWYIIYCKRRRKVIQISFLSDIIHNLQILSSSSTVSLMKHWQQHLHQLYSIVDIIFYKWKVNSENGKR